LSTTPGASAPAADVERPRPIFVGAPPAPPLHGPAPLVTYAIIAVCVVNFLVLNLAQGGVLATAEDLLAPSAVEVWHGAVWGLVTTAFVHVQVWHIAFNMWWARDFGRLLEPDMGRGRFAAFVLATAAVSSGWQLLTTDATGIGFSGVVYALFGYALARRGTHPRYAVLLSRTTVRWLLGWLVLCIGLTVAKVWAVGNAAHVAGLASGWLLGTAMEHPRRRVVAAVGGIVLVLGVVFSLLYMPWSAVWRARGAGRSESGQLSPAGVPLDTALIQADVGVCVRTLPSVGPADAR
jgi:GlpG protein